MRSRYKSVIKTRKSEVIDGIRTTVITTVEEYWPEAAPTWHKETNPNESYLSTHEEKQAILLEDDKEKQFGFNYGSEVWELDSEELAALLSGKTLAREINGGEYSLFLKKCTEEL